MICSHAALLLGKHAVLQKAALIVLPVPELQCFLAVSMSTLSAARVQMHVTLHSFISACVNCRCV